MHQFNSCPFLSLLIWYRALVLDPQDLHPAQEMSAKPMEVGRTWLVQMEPLVAVASPVFCLFWDPCWVVAAVVV